jgi:hypothetical protein
MLVAIQKYDKQEERRAERNRYPHNIYLAGHCLIAVNQIEKDIDRGVDPEVAIKKHSLARFQTALLRCLK